HVHRQIAFNWEILFQLLHHFDVGANHARVGIEFHTLAFVVHADKGIEPAALEGGRDALADLVFEILKLAGNLDMDIDIPVVDTLDLHKNRQVAGFGSRGTEASHAVNHAIPLPETASCAVSNKRLVWPSIRRERRLRKPCLPPARQFDPPGGPSKADAQSQWSCVLPSGSAERAGRRPRIPNPTTMSPHPI